MKSLKSFKQNQQGNLLLFAMVFGAVSFTIIIGGVSGYAMYENRASVYKHNREMAFQIAEAGANYYRWHLAHSNDDYWDGQGPTSTGPYVHDYKDKNGTTIGYFSLSITPPLLGSSVIVVSSTGWIIGQEVSKRTIKIRVGFPAMTDYAFLTNKDVWIGNTEVVHGKLHANGGVRFDGLGDAPVASAKPIYTCQPGHCCNPPAVHDGVWGIGGPQSYWEYPMPSQDFLAVTAKLTEIKENAQDGGIYINSSGKQGWRIRFTSNGKVRARKVNTVYCAYGASTYDGWRYDCIDINSETGSEIEYNMPANGYIYVEDRVWVDGTVNGRATLGVKSGKSIIINGSIVYSAKDGNHVLGLISPQDILIPLYIENNLEIDAALLAQNGAAQRYYYPPGYCWYCQPVHALKNSIYVYGSVITNEVWTWSWVSGGCGGGGGPTVSGFQNTNSTYDSNLTYGPPPGFPVGQEYNLISWEEMEY
ncbi:MAG: hypothetical protein ABIH87_02255 [bacterium]